MKPLYQVRDWTPEDHATITEWRKARMAEEFPACLVPPNAVIVLRDGAPVAFACLFITIPREGGGCLGWCECFTTAPGLSFKVTREAASHVMEFFRLVAKDSGASALIAFGDAVTSRVLRGLGMTRTGSGFDSLIEPLVCQ